MVVGCVRVAFPNVARSWMVLVDGSGIYLSTIALGRVRISHAAQNLTIICKLNAGKLSRVKKRRNPCAVSLPCTYQHGT